MKRPGCGPRLRFAAALATVFVGGCAGTPPAPDWQLDARDSLERASSAYLEGDARVGAAEFARARAAVAATGRADLVARVELTRCAARLASLEVGPCPGFEPLRADAGPQARAYADYLAARPLAPADVARLPAPQQAVAAAITTAAATTTATTPSARPPVATVDLAAIADPLSRLVGAGALFAAGRADAAVAATAVATASARGWRRPLLAWLEVQARGAEAAGAVDDAARLRRRIELVAPAAASPPGPVR